MYEIKLNQFEGPLDLLLELIRQQKLDITQISLAQVADEFLNYVIKEQNRIPLQELSDFLSVASRLLFIKSKTLLPSLIWEEDEEDERLTEQLKIFQEYLLAGKKINNIINQQQFSFPRPYLSLKLNSQISFPVKVDCQTLWHKFSTLVKNLEEKQKLSQKTVRHLISLHQKINQLKDWFSKSKDKDLNFFFLIEHFGQKNREDIILNFLALLELNKRQLIVLCQRQLFEEIIIKKQF